MNSESGGSARRAQTDRRKKVRGRWKRFTLPVLLAILFGAAGFGGLDLVEIAEGAWGEAFALAQKLGLDPASVEATRHASNIALGLLAGSLLTWLLNLFGLIDRLFPDPPSFVFCDLGNERSEALLDLEFGPPPLIGRVDELKSLLEMLGAGRGGHFHWTMLTGPSGVGKTRLAIEWLAALAEQQKPSWDIGVIDPDQLHTIRSWEARRPTALVVDEADSEWFRERVGANGRLETLLGDLAAGSSAKKPVRVLLVGQSPMWGLGQAPKKLRARQGARYLELQPLGEAACFELAAVLAERRGAAAATIAQESAGRPRHALIMANAPDASSYEEALNDWANRAIPELAHEQGNVDPSVALALIAASLVGPLRHSELARALPEFDVRKVRRFFGRETLARLEDSLPALQPQDWGRVLSLRLLAQVPPAFRQEVVEPVLLCLPERLERSLGEIWQGHPQFVTGHKEAPVSEDWHGQMAVTLNLLQRAYDAAWPDRVKDRHSTMRSLLTAWDAERPLPEMHRDLLIAAYLVDRRPFDFEIRQCEARIATNAVNTYRRAVRQNNRDALKQLESWRRRLDKMLAIEPLASDHTIREHEANAVVHAIQTFGDIFASGKSAAFTEGKNGLEQWGERLDAILSSSEFARNPSIRLSEAKAITSASAAYRKAVSAGVLEALYDIDRWCSRLDSLLGVEHLVNDRSFRAHEAGTIAAVLWALGDAFMAGRKNVAASVGRWTERLSEILRRYEFDMSLDLARNAAAATRSAIYAYERMASAGDLEGLVQIEFWGEQLDALLAMGESGSDLEVRRNEAGSVAVAMRAYANAFDVDHNASFADLERWALKFDSILANATFAADTEVRIEEAVAITNATSAYTRAVSRGRHEALVDIERWGRRLDCLLSVSGLGRNKDIRYWELLSAANATLAYKDAYWAGRPDALANVERWAARLNPVAADPVLSLDSSIREAETRVIVNAILACERAEDERWRYWRGKLAKTAQQFPFHPEISARARSQGLSCGDQQANGWAYGRFDPIALR